MGYNRIWNFNPGPAALPEEVLEAIHKEWFNYMGCGMNVMELSHRGKDYEAIHNKAVDTLRNLLGIGPEYHILFLQGGASLQFSMVPMNFLPEGMTADYIHTGAWAGKAIKEAKLFGKVNVMWDGKDHSYARLPRAAELMRSSNPAYVHYTSNETIGGIEFFAHPDFGTAPVICDMSSDILSHRFDARNFSMIYAGAQKNLGPSGVTLVILREDFAKTAKTGLPTMLSYGTHIGENSLYNTPPTFGIYVMSLVLQWIEEKGGLAGIEKINKTKADTLYGAIDGSGDYYRGTVSKESRSWMNITMRLPSEELEDKFIKEAKTAGFIGLKGHRSVGGIRVSLYNAVPLQAVTDLVSFMANFKAKNG